MSRDTSPRRSPIEVDAAQKLNLSRGAYREATRILLAKGLLTSRPKAGTIVSPRSDWNLLDPDVLAWHFESTPDPSVIDDLFELRMIVEPAAAALAAVRRTDTQLLHLREALATMERETLLSEVGRAADRDFHKILLEASGNTMLRSLTSGIRAAVQWTTIYKHQLRGLPRDAIPDHSRVLDAIAAKDAEGARTATIVLLTLALDDTRPETQ